MAETGRYKTIALSLLLLILWEGLSSAQPADLINRGESKREKAIKAQDKESAERREAIYKEMIKRKIFEAETFIEVAERLMKEESDLEAGELLKAAIDLKHAGVQLAINNEYEKALKNLKDSYLFAVQAVKSIRQNKTVTHKKIFETPREEFLYEKDRNDTYLGLTSRFIKDAGNEEIKKLFEEARTKRGSAEDAFGHERYAEAAENMKASCDLLENILEMLAPKP